MKKIIIIGASGHGKVIADIASKIGYSEIEFLDDNKQLECCGIYKIVGTSDDAYFYDGNDFIVAVGNADAREKIQKKIIKKGLNVVSLIHPNAIIAENTIIGVGSVVMAGAVIGPYAKIGNGCIINTCSSVDHDCILGNYVHVAVGAHIAGNVTIKDKTWIGAGATINNDIKISSNNMIGSGAVVVKNITKSGVYIGIPAKFVKKL